MKRSNKSRHSPKVSRRRSSSQRPGHKGGFDFKATGLLAGMALTSVGGGGYALYAYTGIEKPDADFCYARADQERKAVFLDNSVTPALAPGQVRDLERAFERVYADAAPNARIAIYTTAADVNGSLVEPVAVICRPPATPSEQAAINAPEQNAPYLAKQYDKARKVYARKVTGILADAGNVAKAASSSPILEQLQAISRHRDFQGHHRSLTVITDGVQNSELAEFCVKSGHMPSHARFARRGDYASVIAPQSLEGVSVDLLLIELFSFPIAQAPYCSNAELRQWWPDYFHHNGASNVALTRLRFWGRQ